jgi:hypothetical protein
MDKADAAQAVRDRKGLRKRFGAELGDSIELGSRYLLVVAGKRCFAFSDQAAARQALRILNQSPGPLPELRGDRARRLHSSALTPGEGVPGWKLGGVLSERLPSVSLAAIDSLDRVADHAEARRLEGKARERNRAERDAAERERQKEIARYGVTLD